MSKTITIIDTFGFFFRSFYALPPLKNAQGFPTGLLTGFVNFIDRLHQDHSSDYIVFALDSKGETFRNKIDPLYKANRKPPPEELSEQLPVAIEWIKKMGFCTVSQSGYEADDMIASLVKVAKKLDIKVRIVSHDKDLYQLIDDDKVVLVDAIKRAQVNEDACFEKYGVLPEQFIDYQAILGDSADNIKGIKGIGKVGAQKLLSEYKTLENIYANVDTITPKSIQKKLIDGVDDARISKELVTLKDDLFDSVDFEKFKMSDQNPFLPIIDDLREYEMSSILRKLEAKNLTLKIDVAPKTTKFKKVLITEAHVLREVVDGIDQGSIIAFDTETTGLDYQSDSLVGFSFCFDEHVAYYVPVAHGYLGVSKQLDVATAQESIREIFTHKVIGHNLKFDLHFLSKFMSDFKPSIYVDTMVLAWLKNPQSPLALDALASSVLSYTMLGFKDIVKKGENFSTVELERACEYAAEDAWATLKLFRYYFTNLKSTLFKLAVDVEAQFTLVLFKMEQIGIEVDCELLNNLASQTALKLKDLEKSIYELSGSEFNINSPKQLGAILFEKLQLKVIRKTKSGYSTDEKVLQALRDEHEVVVKLLEYRELHKLYSTYLLPLAALGLKDPQNRIHTSFVQTGTATGRLSSKNPNLQNIPTRSTHGAKIREAFVAPEGRVLLGLDYSQIELRLLAHFSQDERLVTAFRDDEDIHLATATALFGVDEAHLKRSIAKTVNFGLLYGMGAKKLSQTLGVSIAEAKEIIERYFESFPTIKEYFISIVSGAKESGFVQTLIGRRRYFDFAHATAMQLAAYERESVNTLFQGSASDLIKLSMIKIFQEIEQQGLDAKMLLQIHDELIFEVEQSRAEEYLQIFKSILEQTYTLSVPLKVSAKIGLNWAELK